MESAILHNIRCLSFSIVYKCRRIPSYDLTSLSSKVDREYRPVESTLTERYKKIPKQIYCTIF